MRKVIVNREVIDDQDWYPVGVKQDDMFIPVWNFDHDDQAVAFAENLQDMFRALNIDCEATDE